MLHLYRRHRKDCQHRSEGRKYRRCQCPIWCQGSIGKKDIRETLGTRNWMDASAKIQKWEAENRIIEAEGPVTLTQAWEKMLTDVEARNLSAQTIRKYKLLKRQMTVYSEAHRLQFVSDFNLDTLSCFRATWKEGPRTAAKKLERLRAFFAFCFDRHWVNENLAKKLKGPKILPAPTMPLEPEEMVALLGACDDIVATAQPGAAKLNALRLKALILLMRYSGLRVSDAVTLTTDRIDGKKLFVRAAKTGVVVHTILPDAVVHVLAECPRVTETRFFRSGQGKRETAVCDWQGRIKDAFDRAGIVKGLSNAVSHRLRDTFAVSLLLAGVPLERLAALLGNSVRVAERHYAPWVRARQEQLEADVSATWKLDPTLNDSVTKGTCQVHGNSPRYN